MGGVVCLWGANIGQAWAAQSPSPCCIWLPCSLLTPHPRCCEVAVVSSSRSAVKLPPRDSTCKGARIYPLKGASQAVHPAPAVNRLDPEAEHTGNNQWNPVHYTSS